MKRLQKLLRNERGDGTLAMIIIMFPMIILVFGLAIDVSKGHYVRQELQNAAQTAAVSATQDININGKIKKADALATAIQYYDKNRSTLVGTLACAKRSDLKTGEKLYGGTCPWILSKWTISSDKKTVTMHIREYVNKGWTKALGSSWAINIETSAKVVQN